MIESDIIQAAQAEYEKQVKRGVSTESMVTSAFIAGLIMGYGAAVASRIAQMVVDHEKL